MRGLFGQTIWFMLNICFPSTGLRFWNVPGRGCLGNQPPVRTPEDTTSQVLPQFCAEERARLWDSIAEDLESCAWFSLDLIPCTFPTASHLSLSWITAVTTNTCFVLWVLLENPRNWGWSLGPLTPFVMLIPSSWYFGYHYKWSFSGWVRWRKVWIPPDLTSCLTPLGLWEETWKMLGTYYLPTLQAFISVTPLWSSILFCVIFLIH